MHIFGKQQKTEVRLFRQLGLTNLGSVTIQGPEPCVYYAEPRIIGKSWLRWMQHAMQLTSATAPLEKILSWV